MSPGFRYPTSSWIPLQNFSQELDMLKTNFPFYSLLISVTVASSFKPKPNRFSHIQFISKSCHMPSSPPTSPSPRTLILAAINLSFKILDRLYPPCGVCLVAQLCPTLCDPMDCSPPGSSVHGISQARILEWVAISFSRGSSQPRDRTSVSCIAGGFFTTEPQLLLYSNGHSNQRNLLNT